MNNNPTTLKLIDGIYDIQPPTSPSLSSLETSLVSLIIISVVCLIAYFIWLSFFSKKTVAKRRIKKLQLKYYDNKVNTHNAVYEVCAILQQGLNIKRIDHKTPLATKTMIHEDKWADFTKIISTLRYNNKVISDSDMHTLFNDSLFWLKH